jgi:Cysteine-rich CWC
MTTEPASTTATCPRCGGGFHCGMHDPEPCACNRITLDAATLARLRAEFNGCLCWNCLQQLQREAAASSSPSA